MHQDLRYSVMLLCVADIKEQIARTESHIIKESRQVNYWTEYKDVGRLEHRKQIDLLEKELEDMQTSYNEMAGKGRRLAVHI